MTVFKGNLKNSKEINYLQKETSEETKEVIRSCKSKDR